MSKTTTPASNVPAGLVDLGRDTDGQLVTDLTYGVVWYLTECCAASATGTDSGVACRSCYRPINPALGMAWTVADYADTTVCTTCGDTLHWCPKSPLHGRGTGQ